MKKLILPSILSFVLPLLLTSSSFAQSPCGTDEAVRQAYREFPELELEAKQLLENSKQIVYNHGDAITIYTIPVVFHILHQYGSENLSDDKVYSEIEKTNLDYAFLSSDTNEIVPIFKPIASASHIRFRLATKDPNGNCTNGIEHIFSHETNVGDGGSKLNQWPRNRYLNVWVVGSFASNPNLLGFSLFPAAVAGAGFKADGIVLLNTVVGSTSASLERTLAHEAGHWMSLSHPWGGTNDPNVACGDDGISDTPVTKGHFDCVLDRAECTAGIIENTQNIMDYTGCPRMFTAGQVIAMETTLNSPVSYRNNLWTDENLAFTGANAFAPPYTDLNIGANCAPIADFVSGRYVCLGGSTTFTSKSWRAKVTSYSWTFEGGTPSTSTAASPTVKYDSPGWHKVTFSAGNAVGTDTKVAEDYIYVSNGWADFAGTHFEDVETGTSNWWIVENPESNTASWQVASDAGFSGTHSFRLNNFGSGPSYQMGGNTDAILSPSYDLRYTKNATLSFKYSAATTADVSTDITEKLKVYSTSDCGVTWTSLKSITGPALANAGNFTTSFVPDNSALWVNVTLNLTSAQAKPNVRFKFEYTASDFSNNIFLDDINVSGTNVGTGEISKDYFSFNVFPNPAGNSTNLNIAFYNHGDNMKVELVDVLGRIVYTAFDNIEGERVFELNTKKEGLHAGIYFVTISDGMNVQTKKALIQD